MYGNQKIPLFIETIQKGQNLTVVKNTFRWIAKSKHKHLIFCSIFFVHESPKVHFMGRQSHVFYLWCNWSICTAILLSRVNYLRHPDLWECLDQERCWVRMTSNLGSGARTMSRGSCLPWPQWWTPRAGCSPAGLWNGAFFAAVWIIWRFCFHENNCVSMDIF